MDTHLEVWAAETHVSPSDKSWYKWIKAAEKLARHHMDGDEKENGYSMDSAFDAWEKGDTPDKYVKNIFNHGPFDMFFTG
jgi:hypothetical protein